jgi:hypothetical protein
MVYKCLLMLIFSKDHEKYKKYGLEIIACSIKSFKKYPEHIVKSRKTVNQSASSDLFIILM